MTTAEVFRTEWSRLVAVLVRDFGDLDLAEECAQEAFLEATARWSDGLPENPAAWLTTTARRKAIDRIRRSSTYKIKLEEVEAAERQRPADSQRDIVDDQLALLLGCCHPALNVEAQVALTLRIVGGLSTEQIASAFLVESATMGKRLTRAKTKIRQAKIPFRPVDREVLAERVAAVRHVIYLIFNEGHASRTGLSFVRGDLCEEALWLASTLTELIPDDSESHGLLALILFADSRRATRLDGEGIPILLEHQDRSLWDQAKITRGLESLDHGLRIASEQGVEPGPMWLQAAVAGMHANAASVDETPWSRVVVLYDRMLAQSADPVVALNRAVALAYATSPEQGLAAMNTLTEPLANYLYFHSARAELLRRLGRCAEAVAAYDAALACNPAQAEALFLHRKRNQVANTQSSG